MKRAIAWFAENHVAANLLMGLLVLGGIASLGLINQKSFIDLDIEVVQVGVPFLGATPGEAEESVCVRIEEEIQSIEGIERITSSASEGACGVSAELISGYPKDRALSQIKNAVDGIDTFPEDTEQPVVSLVEIRRNALQIALHGAADERALKVWGERLRDQISGLETVTQVDLAGVRAYEISIEVPESALRRHGLTFAEVAQAVRRGSLDRPGGSIDTPGGEVLLRTKGQAYTGEEFEDIVVLTRTDGTRLRLGEIASVRDGYTEDPIYSRFDGDQAVLIKVYRVGDQKLLQLVAEVKDWVATASHQLPEALSLTVWRDGSWALRQRLDVLIRNGRMGFILVFVALALFLRLRLAFWVALGVPIAFLGTLSMFPPLGISIDVISLFAFIMVLGILVDDAIVVGENVHRHQQQGDDPLQGAIRGAQEVAIPVIFGVLTTVAAFLPMMLSPGTFGQVFGAIAGVVILCLFFSVVESQLVLPAHLGHMKASPPRDTHAWQGSGVRASWRRAQAAIAESLEKVASRFYRPALDRALEWRYATLSAGVVMLMITLVWIGSGRMKFSFFPPIESDYVSARLTMPLGTPVELTAAAVQGIEQAAWQLDRELEEQFGEDVVLHVLATVGQQPSLTSGPPRPGMDGVSGTHYGEVSIELLGADDRPLTAKAVADRWRELSPPIPDVEQLTYASALFSGGDPIDVQLASADVGQLQRAAELLKQKLAQYPGVFDIADSFREGKQEIRLSLLPSAEPLGLSLEELSRQVRQAFYGEEAQRIQRGRDDVRVMVRYPRSGRSSLEDLEDLRIRAPGGAEVPFYAVARADLGRGYATIRRADRQRVINVTADVDESQANANEVLADLQQSYIPQLLADHPGLAYGLEGEQREQQQTFAALRRNYLFALAVIYALLAVPLRSYSQPLIIMAVIPFGLVGAIGGHVLMGQRVPALGHLSMMSIFGVVALSGVVVNASLVLVHYINTRRAWGSSLLDAVREAGEARFRPIVLTALTTFLGLAPLLAEKSVGAQFLIPMATSLAFGVVFASFISLFLVPSSYVILDDLARLFARLRIRVWQWLSAEPKPARHAEPGRAAGAVPLEGVRRGEP